MLYPTYYIIKFKTSVIQKKITGSVYNIDFNVNSIFKYSNILTKLIRILFRADSYQFCLEQARIEKRKTNFSILRLELWSGIAGGIVTLSFKVSKINVLCVMTLQLK